MRSRVRFVCGVERAWISASPTGRARAILRPLHRYHGALGVPFATPAPTLIQSGWTNDLFPIGQGLRMYEALRRAAAGSYVSLQLGDLGQDRGGRHRLDTLAMEAAALRFSDRYVKGRRPAGAPRTGSVVAYRQSCPRDAPRGAGPWGAARYGGLAHGSVAPRSAAPRQRVTSTGGDPSLAKAIAPLGFDACKRFPAHRASGTALATLRSPGVTLLGRPTVRCPTGSRDASPSSTRACRTSAPAASGSSTAASPAWRPPAPWPSG